MQLLEILTALSRTELAELDAHIHSTGRKEMQALYDELKKIKNKPRLYDREKIFKNVFEKSFSGKKDYLLKNEIRHLKNAIYQFLAEKELKGEIRSNQNFLNLWVLKALEKRNIKKLFASEVEKMIITAQKSFSTELMTGMMGVKHNFYARPSLASPSDHKDHLEFLEAWINTEAQQMAHSIRSIESNKAFLLRAIKIKKDYSGSFEEAIDFEPVQNIELARFENDYTAFIQCFTDSYLKRGNERIDCLKNALKLLQAADPKFPESHEDEVTLLFNIASALMTERLYEEADRYLQQSVETAKKYKVTIPLSIHFMMLRNYLFLQQYEEAVKYFEANHQDVLDNPYMDHAVISVAFAHLYLGNSKDAIRLLNFETNSPEAEARQLLHRYYVNIIGFIVDDELDHAFRELSNFKKFISRKKQKRHSELLNYQLLEKYVSVKAADKKDQQALLATLNDQIQHTDHNQEVISNAFLWLKRRVEDEMAGYD